MIGPYQPTPAPIRAPIPAPIRATAAMSVRLREIATAGARETKGARPVAVDPQAGLDGRSNRACVPPERSRTAPTLGGWDRGWRFGYLKSHTVPRDPPGLRPMREKYTLAGPPAGRAGHRGWAGLRSARGGSEIARLRAQEDQPLRCLGHEDAGLGRSRSGHFLTPRVFPRPVALPKT